MAAGYGDNDLAYWVTANTSSVPRTAILAVTCDAGTTQTCTITQAGTSAIALGTVLDNTNLTWTTGGPTTWYGETGTSHDGVDSAHSGALADSQTNWFQTMVTGPGTVRFWWKVSSEAGWDFLRFRIDGGQDEAISGNVDWQEAVFAVGAGTHTLGWLYSKDESLSAGSDCGWVDQVVWSPGGTRATQNSPVPVPFDWLDGHHLVAGGDYEGAALADVDGDGLAAWQEYVVGSLPTNRSSTLRVLIGVSNGAPVASWSPDLGTARVYKVEGKASLADPTWRAVTNGAPHFFRVKVSLE